MAWSEAQKAAASERAKAQHAARQQGEVMVAEKPVAAKPRTDRGRRRMLGNGRALTPLEQIRAVPNSGTGTLTGAWAYYINPDGATIRDALILYPNGGIPPATVQNYRKYGENADLYRARQARKGLEFVGSNLTAEGVRRLIEVLRTNQPDEVLDLEDQIAECEQDIANSDRPDWRDNQKKRRAQLQQRLDYVKAPLDADGLTAELNDIARAQRMAKVSPETLLVMREMLGELEARQSATFNAALEKFKGGVSSADADESLGAMA